MKFTSKTPNTLSLALWVAKDAAGALRTLAVGSLCGLDGEQIDVGEMGGSDPIDTLVRTLEDMKPLVARYVIVFTNSKRVVGLYSRPVRLEPTAPDRMGFYDPKQWAVLRYLCGYERWRFVHLSKLPAVERKWAERFATSRAA